MPTNFRPETDYGMGPGVIPLMETPRALVDLARKSIDEREAKPVSVFRWVNPDLFPSPIFDQLQLRDVEMEAEESLTAALAALQSGDRDLAVLHMVAALESTARADALEQKETI